MLFLRKERTSILFWHSFSVFNNWAESELMIVPLMYSASDTSLVGTFVRASSQIRVVRRGKTIVCVTSLLVRLLHFSFFFGPHCHGTHVLVCSEWCASVIIANLLNSCPFIGVAFCWRLVWRNLPHLKNYTGKRGAHSWRRQNTTTTTVQRWRRRL